MQDRILRRIFTRRYCIAGMGVVLTQACSHSFYRCFFLAYLFSPLVDVLVK